MQATPAPESTLDLRPLWNGLGKGFGFRVQDLGFRHFGFWVWGFRVLGIGIEDLEFAAELP